MRVLISYFSLTGNTTQIARDPARTVVSEIPDRPKVLRRLYALGLPLISVQHIEGD